MSESATINVIRTERLSKTLRAMSEKSASMPKSKRGGGLRTYDDDDDDSEVSSKKSSLARTHSGSTLDDIDSLYRYGSPTSLRKRNQFRSLRIPASNSDDSSKKSAGVDSLDEDGKGKRLSEISPPLAIGCETLNRFVRHLIPRREELSSRGVSRKAPNHHRARTITVCNRIQLRVHKSPSPTPRLRAETESIGKIDSKSRKSIQQQASKSSSTGSSSRSLSPMPVFAAGKLGSFSTDQQLSPGSPLSPSYTDGKFTVLVVGSEGIGKTALINRFLQADSRRASPAYDPGSDIGDNSVSVITEGEETQLKFIQVNNQKSDLWLSLSGAAYVVMYHFDDNNSFRNAIDVVARLRERNDTSTKPIMLVSNKQSAEKKRFVIANDEGRHVAKQNKCRFHEIYVSAGRSVNDLLTSIVSAVRYHYLQRQETDASIDDGRISPHLFDLASTNGGRSPQASNNKGWLGQKLWPRKRVKQCKSAEGADELIKVCGHVSLANGLQWFGVRRDSRSLENLAIRAKGEKCP